MLNQLVESRNTGKDNKKKNVLLLVTMVIIFACGTFALGYSLFNENVLLGGDGLELSTLVAPPIPEEAPPPPEEQEPEKEKPQKKVNADVRKELIANLDMSPPKTPPKVSIVKSNTPPVRTNVDTIQSDKNANSFDNSQDRSKPKDIQNSKGFEAGGNQEGIKGGGNPTPTPVKRKTPPPLRTPKPKPKVPSRISGGVINGKATSLPQPAYPAAARSANIKGSVRVSVVISKTGRVLSARASSGHPLLKRAAQSAARRAKFRPTLLSGQPVEVSGVIVYNFR